MRRHIVSSIVLALVALAAAPAFAQEAAKDAAKTEAKAPPKGVTSWKETLELAEDGSAKVVLDLVLSNWESDSIDLPLSYAKAEGVEVVSTDVAATAQAGKAGDMRVLKLKFDKKPPAQAKLGVTFAAKGFLDMKKARSPRGFYALNYTFANLSTANVGTYSLKVVLPAGYKMTQVLSSTPKATGNEVTPPFDFRDEGGKTVVNLRSPSIAVGKSAAISFNFQPARKHAFALVAAAIVIAAVAMYAKRDVLTREDYVPETGG